MAIVVPEQVLATATARFGLRPAELRPLQREGAPDGAVYRCRVAGRQHYFKIKPMAAGRTVEQARAEFAEHLRAGGIAVPVPVPSADGALLEIVAHDGTDFAVTLTVEAPGRHLRIPEDWGRPLVRAWGTTLGRMHALATGFAGADGLTSWRHEITGFRESCRDERLGAVWDEFAANMELLPAEPEGFGAVHNDLHLGNLLLADAGAHGPDSAAGNADTDTDTELIVLDFDVCTRHWFAADLAIALVHPLWDLRRRDPAGMRQFVDDFLDGYTGQHPLKPQWRERLPMFMRYRMTLLVLAVSRELGHPETLPPWLAAIRAWVLSGEPIVDLD